MPSGMLQIPSNSTGKLNQLRYSILFHATDSVLMRHFNTQLGPCFRVYTMSDTFHMPIAQLNTEFSHQIITEFFISNNSQPFVSLSVFTSH
mmetsp:Transcript_5921/g.10506  ORF Transcript_5921/g.10506 Transcript_5921/m.10506 type:complete len:91 (+) Transcript_5921:601-873(+)